MVKLAILLTAVIISVISWASIYFLKKRLHPLEILAYYLFYTTLLQQSFTILTLNLHRFEMTDGVAVMLPVKIMGLSYYPIINLWLLSFLGSRRYSLTSKFLLTVLFQLLLFGMDFLHGWTGYIKEIHWPLIYGVLRPLILLLLLLLFMTGYRKLLRKERIIT